MANWDSSIDKEISISERYSISTFIAKGGMAKTYLAYDKHEKREVVIKAVDGLNDNFSQRLLREKKYLDLCRHPNIPKAYCMEQDASGRSVLVLEYIEGKTLCDILDSKKEISLKEIMIWMNGIVSALSCVHENEIIHRDVKPQNIMIDNKENKAWLIDFGLSKKVGENSLTQHESALGTNGYKSPEQLRGENLSYYSDVYSLGCVFYDMLLKLVSNERRSGDNKKPDLKKIKKVPSKLIEVCKKMLIENPNKRVALYKLNFELPKVLNLSKIILYIFLFMFMFLIFMFFYNYNHRNKTYKKSEDNRAKIIEKLKQIKFEQTEIYRKCWSKRKKLFDFTKSEWLQLSHQDQVKNARIYRLWYAQKNDLKLKKIYEINGENITFNLIPPGKIRIGSPEHYEHKCKCEVLETITIKNYFYVSTCEITQRQWKSITGNNPSTFRNLNSPVENVSWIDVNNFCKKTKTKLPSEVQWEYACRAGCSGIYSFGDNTSKLYYYIWTDEEKTSPVGTKNPNAFGLFDMLGNVFEWCQDQRATIHIKKGETRAIKGGGWDTKQTCTSGFRGTETVDTRGNYIGFRLILPKIQANTQPKNQKGVFYLLLVFFIVLSFFVVIDIAKTKKFETPYKTK